ncbi:DUF1120 domain-containing protein [Enterobacter cloacae complex sp. ECC445]|uniref:DUF1120 domain-containing protein n=1 Tax=Enterobacter cloacae complex sp. ECC445 TaxID=2913213 RepID=UPI001F298C1D|nr:DUF1120 domain-containing protein [Enterobacter cloacae complex sp. ECC445]MCG0456384.1 DUF1120 domain-containing protein [Enterobacter cloacae complex sp. ECC445]
MKKSLLAAALALATTCAHAGDTAVLKVKASLTSNSCTPELSNNGVIDFGTVQVGDLSQTQTTQLGEKSLTLTITCPTPTKVGWSIADNRADSNASTGTNSNLKVMNATSNGGELRGSMTTFGLGKTHDGKNIGAYSIYTSTGEVTANGATVEPIRTAVTAGAGMSRWQKANGGTIANKDLGLMSVSSAGKTDPMAVTSVSFPLNISLAVENLKKLSLKEDTEFDGQATISVVYL